MRKISYNYKERGTGNFVPQQGTPVIFEVGAEKIYASYVAAKGGQAPRLVHVASGMVLLDGADVFRYTRPQLIERFKALLDDYCARVMSTIRAQEVINPIPKGFI